MQKLEVTITKINVLFLSLVLILGLWNLGIFFIPAILLAAITFVIKISHYRKKVSVSVIFLLGGLLWLYEIINYCYSGCKPNSILFLRDFILVGCCVFIAIEVLKDRKYRTWLVIFISLLAGLFSLANLPIFFFRYYEAMIYGFDDFSQFRFLYQPLGFLSNEWVTVLLCFLPFPLTGSVLFWKKPFIRFGFLFITTLLVFNFFISFSRAGWLAFLLFLILLNIFLYIFCRFPVKKMLFPTLIVFGGIVIFTCCFSESIQSSIQQTNSHRRSLEGRLKQWEQVIKRSDGSPYFGIGSKNYALLGRFPQSDNWESAFTGRVNSTYFQLIIEKGWIGFSVWLCIGVIIIYFSFQCIRQVTASLDKVIESIMLSAICAVLFREFFFSSLFYNSGILLLFFILVIFSGEKMNKTLPVQKSVLIGLGSFFMLGAIYFFFITPDNALFYAKKGLECERTLTIKKYPSPFHEGFDSFSKAKQDTISYAIEYYKKACRLSPCTGMFQHNLGWLYLMNCQLDSASIYLRRATSLEPDIALYHISYGLINESQHPKKAFESYLEAVLLSPDILDSSFFKDLKKRYPAKTSELLETAFEKMSERLSVKYSSIIEAKSGKIALSLGDTAHAYEVFLHVTRIHPNLSRPWYYLGLIEQEKGNFTSMQLLYKRALFLSSFDHLPLSAFADYYNQIGDKSKADLYYKMVEKAWKNKRSVHSSRCRRLYYLDTEKDDVIPNGFLDYITPTFQF